MQELIPSSGENLEKEIAILESRLEEKKKEMAGRAIEKDTIKAAVKERIFESASLAVSSSGKSTKSDSDSKKDFSVPLFTGQSVSVSDLKNLDPQKQVGILLGIAISDSLTKAALLANDINNPFVLDEFHDVLADRFFEELKKRGKI